MLLLKNENGLLPFHASKTNDERVIAVIGWGANDTYMQLGNYIGFGTVLARVLSGRRCCHTIPTLLMMYYCVVEGVKWITTGDQCATAVVAMPHFHLPLESSHLIFVWF